MVRSFSISRQCFLTFLLLFFTAVNADQFTLLSSDRDSGDLFGTSVDFDDTTAAIGAHFWEDLSPSVGNQGAAYIFEQAGTGAWIQTQIISTDNIPGFTPNGLDNFGIDLALDGDTLVVGAFKADINGMSDSGAAFVFGRDSSGNWNHESTLIPNDLAAGDRYGQFVDLDGNTIVVGAIEKSGQQGAAYIFERASSTSTNWIETEKLSLLETGLSNPQFGHGVAVSRETVVVSTSGQHANGKAYIYERTAGSWNVSTPKIIEGSTIGTVTGDNFGFRVSLDEQALAVSAINDDAAGNNAGAVYVFGRNFNPVNPEVELSNNWGLIKKVLNPDSPNQPSEFDEFGISVAVNEDILLVGSLNDDDFGTSSGSAVEFNRNVGGNNNWGFVHEHHAPQADQSDWINYGTSVAIEEDIFLIGAQHTFSNSGLGGSAYITESYLLENPVSAISFYRGQDPTAQLHMTDLAGNNLQQLSISSKPETVHSWSPDGTRLLFTRQSAAASNSPDIIIAEVDEQGIITSETNVTNNPFNDHSAAWMPDGNTIVFASNREDNNFQLYEMDVSDLSNIPSIPITKITTTNENELHPSVASNGTIAVTQNENALVLLQKMNDNYSVLPAIYNAVGVFTPSWSPDGTSIVFSAGSSPGGSVTNDLKVYRIDVDVNLDPVGTAVDISPGFGHGPSWKPNSQQVVYVANNNGAPGPITKLNVDTMTIELTGQVGNLPQWRPLQSSEPDSDGDGIPDASDNCPSISNPDQFDLDNDGLGNVCDPDDDNDLVDDVFDNCPVNFNADQANADNDSLGDACDADDDNDNILDLDDNCPVVANPNQENFDGDVLGDACDPDDDNDGVNDGFDNCPLVFNPNQTDSNSDGFGDACVASEIPSDVIIGFNPQIGSGVVFESGTSIGDNAVINDNVQLKENVTVGDDVFLDEEVVLEKLSTLGNNVSIGRYTKVEENVVIGSDNQIGENTVIKKDVVIEDSVVIGDFVTIEEGAIIGTAVEIGDNVKIGKNAWIAPGVVIASGSEVEEGATILPESFASVFSFSWNVNTIKYFIDDDNEGYRWGGGNYDKDDVAAMVESWVPHQSTFTMQRVFTAEDANILLQTKSSVFEATARANVLFLFGNLDDSDQITIDFESSNDIQFSIEEDWELLEVIHEVGHALGLAHTPFSDSPIPPTGVVPIMWVPSPSCIYFNINCGDSHLRNNWRITGVDIVSLQLKYGAPQ
ncbi:MAG: hypothetical protein GKR91_06385 [Pseudomonadales bacterium]|nr:hypothetical protein [Pseudomonadales bacterium]